jgi:hypothetical protein
MTGTVTGLRGTRFGFIASDGRPEPPERGPRRPARLTGNRFQRAGTASTNPLLLGLDVFLALAWNVAGRWGLDRWLLTRLGTPWARGPAFTESKVVPVRPPRVAPA